MLEARIQHGAVWKKVIDSIKELVTEANFDCSPGGISIQAMDTAHVALVNLVLRADGFRPYNCEQSGVLGINLNNLSKILKTTENNDVITLRHDEDSDVLSIIADAADSSKTSEYQMRLMEIEADAMGIPEMDYKSVVSMSSAEFAKICRDMTIFGDTVTVAVNREGVKFSASSEIGEGFAMLKAGSAAAEGGAAARTKVEPSVKSEGGADGIKKERKIKTDVDTEDGAAPPAAAAATGGGRSTGDGVFIRLEEPVTLSFALRYFTTFSKGSALSDRVELHFAKDSPCMIEFKIDGLGYLRYYLAPKVDAGEAS